MYIGSRHVVLRHLAGRDQVGHGRQDVRAVDAVALGAEHQVVARGAPGGLLQHLDVGHAVLGEEAFLLGDHQRRGIGQRDVAELGGLGLGTGSLREGARRQRGTCGGEQSSGSGKLKQRATSLHDLEASRSGVRASSFPGVWSLADRAMPKSARYASIRVGSKGRPSQNRSAPSVMAPLPERGAPGLRVHALGLEVVGRRRKAEICGSLAEQVGAIDRVGGRGDVDAVADLPPAAHLRERPARMRTPREAGGVAIEGRADAIGVGAGGQSVLDHVGRCVDRFRTGQPVRGLGVVGRHAQPGGGADQRPQQRAQGCGMARRPVLGDGEDLFRRVVPDVIAIGDDAADAQALRQAVPGCADAIAVDTPRREIGDHLRRRHDKQPHIAVGIDAAGGEPIAQHVVVAGMLEHDAEGRRWQALGAALFERPAQGAHGRQGAGFARHARGIDVLGERHRQRHGVAVDIERQRHRHRHAPAAEAQGAGQWHCRQHVRAVENARPHQIADRRP